MIDRYKDSEEKMEKTATGRLTGFSIDIVVRLLRSQISALENLRQSIEQDHSFDDYAQESIKGVEKNLRWLRELFTNN